jgi:hypothetical protein
MVEPLPLPIDFKVVLSIALLTFSFVHLANLISLHWARLHSEKFLQDKKMSPPPPPPPTVPRNALWTGNKSNLRRRRLLFPYICSYSSRGERGT